jgi:short-subunit dehydrogenase
MLKKKLTAIIVGVSSDIGLALAKHLATSGVNVFGTYRSKSSELISSMDIFKKLFYCDLLSKSSINKLINEMSNQNIRWDILVLCPGTMNPIGAFQDCNMDDWENGFLVNLLSPLRITHGILPFRRQINFMPLVVFFAGGGVNGAPLNYSSYTTSKIALIKATELLDSEFKDVRFSIIGPGWVRTKIHQETLVASDRANYAAKETLRRLECDQFNSVANVISCLDWLIDTPKKIIGGRNFSVVHDKWGDPDFEAALQVDPNKYKLRRYGNS